jgi:hypothetical protein
MTGIKPFSIRDFLAYGTRAAVDQAFARLLKNGEVIRVARGLYIKGNAPPPSVLEVAIAKATAFRRTIAIHGSRAALHLRLHEHIAPIQGKGEHCFAASGRSTSFRFGNQIIRFIGTSARKLYFADSKPGLAIRALWHLGQMACSMAVASEAIRPFGRSDREDWKLHADIMPEWMHDVFHSITRNWEEIRRQEAKTVWLRDQDPAFSPTLLRRQAFPRSSTDA